MRILAIDPGQTCGLAVLRIEGRDVVVDTPQAVLPGALYHFLEHQTFHAVVVEEFRLYPWMAQYQGYSTLPTVEVIGVIKYLTCRAGVGLYLQRADVKKEARGIAENLGWPMKVRSLGSGKGKYRGPDFDYPGAQHPRDALAHGVWWAYRDPMSPLKNADAEVTT